MNWKEVLGLEIGDEKIRSINRELENRHESGRVEDFGRKFRPGTVKRLVPYEGRSELGADIPDIPRDPSVIGNLLKAYSATDYVEKVREDSTRSKYTLHSEYREETIDFAKAKLARDADQKLGEYNADRIHRELDQHNLVEDSFQIGGEIRIDAKKGVEYSDETVEYLEELSLVTLDRELLGTSEDIEVVEKVVEEKQKESGSNREEDSLSVVFQ